VLHDVRGGDDALELLGNLVRRLQRLAYEVTIAPRVPPALPVSPEPVG
jgi:hypothetical protein